MNAPAKPAAFDRFHQQRRTMIAKIHVARKELMIDEDDYRQIIFDEANSKASLTQCTVGELEMILTRLKALGFKPKPTGGRGVATHPMARKARALWISLYHLGAVHNPAEQALEAFACKQLGCEKLIWARQSDAYRLIEALKAMAIRNGWRQTNSAGQKLSPVTLQSHLCDVILAKLKAAGVVPDEWGLHHAMWRLCGIENAREKGWTAEDYARLAAALGQKLREAGAGR